MTRDEGKLVFTLALLGARRELRYPSLILAQLSFLAVVLYVFARLWHTAAESGFVSYVLPGDYVWYLMLTELVVLSVPGVFRPMQDEILSGDVLQRVLKPVPYPLVPFGEALGMTVARLLFLAPFGVIFCFLLTGGAPGTLTGLAAGLVLVPLSCTVFLLFLLAIGLLVPWLHDVAPAFWIFSKANFVLGGLMLPLSIYPESWRHTASATPFFAMLYGVGRNVLGVSVEDFAESALLLLCWGAVSALLVMFLYRRFLRRLVISGG